MADEQWIQSSLAALEELETERQRLEQRLEEESNPDTLRHIVALVGEVDEEIERLYAALNAIADEVEDEVHEPAPKPAASAPTRARQQQSVVVDVSMFAETVDDLDIDDIEELEPDDLEELIERRRHEPTETAVPASRQAASVRAAQPRARVRKKSDTLILEPRPAPVAAPQRAAYVEFGEDDDEQTVVRDVRTLMVEAASSAFRGSAPAKPTAPTHDAAALDRKSVTHSGRSPTPTRRAAGSRALQDLSPLQSEMRARAKAVADTPRSDTRNQPATPARPVSSGASDPRTLQSALETMDPAASRAVTALIQQLDAAASAAQAKLTALSEAAAVEDRTLAERAAQADGRAKEAERVAHETAAQARQLAADAKRARAIAMAAMAAQSEAAALRARELGEAEATYERAQRAARAAAANPQSLLKLKSVQRSLAGLRKGRNDRSGPPVSAAS